MLTTSFTSLRRLPTEEEQYAFYAMTQLIETDKELKKCYGVWGESYIVGIYIYGVSKQNYTVRRNFDFLDLPARETCKIDLYSRYTNTEVDLDADTLHDAIITNKNYRVDECWINALLHFYGDNLLNLNKKGMLLIETLF